MDVSSIGRAYNRFAARIDGFMYKYILNNPHTAPLKVLGIVMSPLLLKLGAPLALDAFKAASEEMYKFGYQSIEFLEHNVLEKIIGHDAAASLSNSMHMAMAISGPNPNIITVISPVEFQTYTITAHDGELVGFGSAGKMVTEDKIELPDWRTDSSLDYKIEVYISHEIVAEGSISDAELASGKKTLELTAVNQTPPADYSWVAWLLAALGVGAGVGLGIRAKLKGKKEIKY